MREFSAKIVSVLLAALVLSFSASAVFAQSPKVFDGKTMTFLAGSSAGGGTDLTARLIARHMDKRLMDMYRKIASMQ